MKEGIHPENYRLVAFKDMSNDDVFITKSTLVNQNLLILLVELISLKIDMLNLKSNLLFINLL